MTARQLSALEQAIKIREEYIRALSYIMMQSDPPFVEKKYINEVLGFGVFSTKEFTKGDFVLEYQGELITHTEAKEREKQYDLNNIGSFIVFFQDDQGKRLCIDATESNGIGRFVNDGWNDKKNTNLKKVLVEGTSHICLFASRTIEKGEEIRFDYGVPNLPWRKLVVNGHSVCCGNETSPNQEDPNFSETNIVGSHQQTASSCCDKTVLDQDEESGQNIMTTDKNSLVKDPNKSNRPTGHEKDTNSDTSKQTIPNETIINGVPDHGVDSFITPTQASKKTKDQGSRSADVSGTESGNMSVSQLSKNACGSCPGCLRTDNCRVCVMCVDMKKYGGPGKKKQKCAMRACYNMSTSRPRSTPRVVMVQPSTPGTSNSKQANRGTTPKKSTSSSRTTNGQRTPHTDRHSTPASRSKTVELCTELLSPVSQATNNSGKKKREIGTTPCRKRSSKNRTKSLTSVKKLSKTKMKGKGLFGMETQKIRKRKSNASNKIFQSPDVSLDPSPRSNCSQDPSTLVYTFCNDVSKRSASTSIEKDVLSDEINEEIGNQCEETLDLGIGWLDAEGEMATTEIESVDENVKVCTQNDMSYLTQSRFRKGMKSFLKAQKDLADITNSNDRERLQSKKRKLMAIVDVFGKDGHVVKRKSFAHYAEDVDQSSIEDEIQTEDQENKGAVNREATRNGKSSSGKKKKTVKINSVPQVEDNCVFPVLNNNVRLNTQLNSSHSLTEEDQDNLIQNEDLMDPLSCRENLASVLQSLEQVLVQYVGQEQGISRKKLAKKINHKKSELHDILRDISSNCSEADETGCSGMMTSQRSQTSQRKIKGQVAGQMLRRLYETLKCQTAECFHQRLGDTSYEIKVNFKDDETEGMLPPDDDGVEDVEMDEVSCTQPDMWRDITVTVRYSTDEDIEKREAERVKQRLERVLLFLDGKIEDLKHGNGDVNKIAKKIVKKVRKNIRELS